MALSIPQCIVDVRELGLLALLIAFAYWTGYHLPGAIRGAKVTIQFAVTAWLKYQEDEREKDRKIHRDIQEHQDKRAADFIEAVSNMCKYQPPPRE